MKVWGHTGVDDRAFFQAARYTRRQGLTRLRARSYPPSPLLRRGEGAFVLLQAIKSAQRLGVATMPVRKEGSGIQIVQISGLKVQGFLYKP